MPKHIVQQGECLSSIATEYEYDWESLWNLSENYDLRQRRKNPNVLLPGDELFVPEKQEKQEPRSTDSPHTFVKKNSPVKLRIRFLNAGKAIANEKYRLTIGGQVLEGITDSQGLLLETIPPDARHATLLLGKEKRIIALDVGHLDPLTEVSGIQARLNNLGYDCGEVDGIVGRITDSALKTFQETYQLAITGKADPKTLDKLKELYGC